MFPPLHHCLDEFEDSSTKLLDISVHSVTASSTNNFLWFQLSFVDHGLENSRSLRRKVFFKWLKQIVRLSPKVLHHLGHRKWSVRWYLTVNLLLLIARLSYFCILLWSSIFTDLTRFNSSAKRSGLRRSGWFAVLPKRPALVTAKLSNLQLKSLCSVQLKMLQTADIWAGELTPTVEIWIIQA